MRKVFQLCTAAAVAALFPCAAFAGISASATISSQQLGLNSYQYTLSLTDTGTTPIGTFWFAWIPSYDLLPSATSNFGGPAGWTGIDAPDDFGVASAQWVNTANPLQPGHTLSGFTFDSPDAPGVLAGTSSFFSLPVEQSYVYAGAPEVGQGFTFVPTTVTPEPASVAIAAALPLIFLRRRRPVG